MRILFLSRWYPYPADNGSKLRVSGLLAGLCARHEVTLISFREPGESTDAVVVGSPDPVATHTCAYREFAPGSGRAILGLLGGTPRYLVDTYQEAMDRLIRDVVSQTRFDLVIASQLPMAAYYRAFQGIPAVFEEVELGIYWPRAADPLWARARKRLTWAKHSRFVARLLENFAFCTVVSEEERRLVGIATPRYAAVHVVPNSVSAPVALSPAAVRVPGSLIFTGSLRFAPNHEAMKWFVADVLPSIRRAVPDACLTITGDPGGRDLAAAGMVLAGHVPDVRPLVAAASVSIAPILSGGGTRLKILEAMAVGTPVVATSKAVEGIDAVNGEHLLVADTPSSFAASVSRLLSDPAAARAMAERARRLFAERYDADVVVPRFLHLIDLAAV